MKKTLFLIAIVPPADICEDVRHMKELMKARFQASHAIKLPAHITVQRPFFVEENQADFLDFQLQKFAEFQKEFLVKMRDFGSFPPRVVFVAIENHEPLIYFNQQLQVALPDEVFQNTKERQLSIHPHITLATRDLHQNNYQEAFQFFKAKHYRNRFTANQFTLFRHDGKIWHRFREYFLQK